MSDDFTAAREQLETALVDADRAMFGDRTEGEMLGDWMVVYQFTDLAREGMPDQMCQFSSASWPRHKQIGFLREALVYNEAAVIREVIEDGDADA